MFSAYRYCYMHSVLTNREDKTYGFCLFLADSTFSKFALYNVDKAHLEAVLKEDGLVYDFAIADGFLKCNPVRRMQITENDLQTFNTVIPCAPETNTIASFIAYGVQNDYVILSHCIMDEPLETEYKGTCFANFADIEISQSTMTAGVKIYDGNTLNKEMLVIMENENLLINDFYFAFTSDKQLPQWFKDTYATCLGKKVLNNQEYFVYQMKSMPLYESNFIVDSAMINKAETMRVKYHNVIGVLNNFKKTLYYMNGFQITDEPISWKGGNSSYKSDYGIYLKSSLQGLTTAQKQECVDWYCSLMEECKGSTELLQKVRKHSSSILVMLAMQTMHAIMTSTESIADITNVCINTINEMRVNRLFCDLYLYKVRLFSYIRKFRLAPLTTPILQGSDEKAFTIVDSRLFYGMEV